MAITTGELARLLKAELIGDNKTLVDSIGEIEDCEKKGVLVVAIADNVLKKLTDYKPQIVVLKKDIPELAAIKLITNKDKEILIELLNIFFPEDHTGFISPQAFIDDSAELGINVKIYPGAFVGHGVKIGDNTCIYPNATIYDNCVIGSNVIIHGGAVIGADGFGFVQKNGLNLKVPQKGIVIIEDDVEIGACTTIDRATLKSTVIGQGTKIDNQVQVGHNTKIGKNCIIVSGVKIAGSVNIEDNVILLGASGVFDHVRIGKNSLISAFTVVTKDCPPNTTLYATPVGREIKSGLKAQAIYNTLPELVKRLEAVEKKLNAD